MQVKNSKGEMEFLRKGIRNDRLFEREELSYKISKELGLNFIPPTKVVNDEKGGVGVLQESAQEYEQSKTPKSKVSLIDHKDMSWKNVMDTLDSGNGLDVALFDFITGNTDRNGANFFIRPDNNKIIGIDNGLSFPAHKKDSLSSDSYKTEEVLWNSAFASTKAKLSKSFIDKLKNPKTFSKITKLLLNSNIENESKFASLFRLSAVMEHIQKNKLEDFDSIDFVNVLTPFLKNMEIKDAKDKRFIETIDTHMKLGYESIINPKVKQARFFS